MSNKLIKVLLSVAVLMLLVTQSALADNVYATIHGKVTDSSGAIVPGAKITATNTQTGVNTNTTSESNGDYQFLQLPVGLYTVVAASTSGFKTFKVTGISLSVNQIYDLPISFKVGAVTETIEVKADAVQVETSSNQLQTVVTAAQMVDMPLINRNFTALEQLAPGVMSSNDRFGTFSVNGSQSQQSSYLVNGTDSNDIALNTPLILPSPDAIQEFNLISSTINPEYGRNSGGIVNALIKNGTNQFHGDVFDFYRDTFLNTHNFFQQTAPVFHQNQFGATLGGPIWKDKTFFFFSYQGVRATQPQNVGVNTVFSAAQRAGAFGGDTSIIVNSFLNGTNNNTAVAMVGDDGAVHPAGTAFFGTGTTGHIFNCGTTPTAANPTCTNPNFANLGAGNFSPLSVSLLKFVPLPNTAGNQFTFNPSTVNQVDQYIARVDHNLTSADQLWGVMFLQAAPSTSTLPFTGASLPGFGSINNSHSKEFTLSETHTFNTTTLNEVRLGYARLNFDAVEPQNPAQPSSFGFTGVNSQDPAGAGAPFIGITGLFSLGFSTNGPQPRKDQNYQFTDNFSKVIGKHTLKFGVDARRFQVDNPFFFNNNGAFSFGGAGNFSSGDPGLDFLLGTPDNFSQNSGGVINARAYEYYGYGQDSWKVRSNLTLNFGAGYQIDTPYNNNQFGGEAFNCFRPGQNGQPAQQSALFPLAPAGLVFPGDTGCTKSGSSIHYGHIGPRVGFAYSPNLGRISGGSSDKFSIRGGFGVYFNRSEEEGALQNLGAPPFGVASNGIGDLGGTPAFANPFVDVSNGQSEPNKFPFSPASVGPKTTFGFFEPLVINVIDPNLSVPYAENFNLNIQREFPANTVVTLGYVGSLGRNLYRAFDGNPISAAGQAACAANPACISGRTLQHLLFPTHSPLAPGNIFSGIGVQATDGSSNYNSMQINVNKGMTHGLSLLTSYTWSHSIDNGSGFENTQGRINVLDPALNIGDSSQDARQRLVLGYTYLIPNLHSRLSWAPDRVFGGWKMSGITTFQTGFPFSLSDSGFTSLSCDALTFYGCPDNPNQLSPVNTLNARNSSFKGKQDFFFNPADFKRAAFGTFGNVPRDSIHGPGINNTDFDLLKDTKITEKTSFQMGIEGYNLFNHTQFGNPNGNILSQNFGRITSAGSGRLVQLRAKINF